MEEKSERYICPISVSIVYNRTGTKRLSQIRAGIKSLLKDFTAYTALNMTTCVVTTMSVQFLLKTGGVKWCRQFFRTISLKISLYLFNNFKLKMYGEKYKKEEENNKYYY